NVGMRPWWHGRPTSATVPREVQRRGARTGALPPRALGPCTDVFEHLAARVLAATAFLGAGVHYFIRRMDVAGLPAADEGLGAAVANDGGERAAAGDNLRRGAARARTILACVQRLQVVAFAIGE